jgi:hypothetical protein
MYKAIYSFQEITEWWKRQVNKKNFSLQILLLFDLYSNRNQGKGAKELGSPLIPNVNLLTKTVIA